MSEPYPFSLSRGAGQCVDCGEPTAWPSAYSAAGETCQPCEDRRSQEARIHGCGTHSVEREAEREVAKAWTAAIHEAEQNRANGFRRYQSADGGEHVTSGPYRLMAAIFGTPRGILRRARKHVAQANS